MLGHSVSHAGWVPYAHFTVEKVSPERSKACPVPPQRLERDRADLKLELMGPKAGHAAAPS